MSKPLGDEPLIALIDLDGTITDQRPWSSNLGVFGPVKPQAKETLLEMKELGWEIIVYTARHWLERDYIRRYLEENGVPVDSVICGKPLGTIYVDDRAVGHKANWGQVRDYLNLDSEQGGFC